jgi:hypothetical protein
MAYVSVDVDIDDVLYAMSDRELQRLCADLIRDGYGPEGSLPTEGYHPDEEMYREAVVKLLDSYSQLTAEQIELVKQLAG